jgi:hypothetical protein
MLISAKTGLSGSARASYACVEPMLRFETPPDKILVAILSSALELQKNYIEELIETETDPMIQWWLAAEPMLARFFDPRTAARLIEGLLAANCDTRLYQLTDYHWLVVYRCLKVFCDLHNDEAATDPTGRADVGPYSIGSIDFDAIVDRFFWDTDFLIGPELLELSADQRRQQLGVSDEAFSIAAGLKPHPSELEIRPVVDPDWRGQDDESPAHGIIGAYPPHARSEDDEDLA